MLYNTIPLIALNKFPIEILEIIEIYTLPHSIYKFYIKYKHTKYKKILDKVYLYMNIIPTNITPIRSWIISEYSYFYNLFMENSLKNVYRDLPLDVYNLFKNIQEYFGISFTDSFVRLILYRYLKEP